MTTVYHGSLYRMLICRAKKEEIKCGKVTAVADLGVRPKCPPFFGFIFFEDMFIHSGKKLILIKFTENIIHQYCKEGTFSLKCCSTGLYLPD